MQTITVDINADIGEGIANEKDLMPLLTSCNIACGGHAGDFKIMTNCVQLAKKFEVKIGAHPSFPDIENFGRQVVNMSCSALYKTIKSQINNLVNVVNNQGAVMHHVKPHGALYNMAAKDKSVAEVIVEVMKNIHLPLKLYVPFGSVIAKIAIKENIPIVYEVFADRNYNDDLTLVSRSNPNAIIHDEVKMTEHVKQMILHNKVTSINGVEVLLKAETICVHGDHPNALKLLMKLHNNLIESEIKIQ